MALVTGKGGVGKTSTSAALGWLAAAQGRRVVVVEIGDQRPSLSGIFNVDIGYEPIEVSPNLSLMNIDWQGALSEWVHQMIPAGRVVEMILENHIVRRFLDATPGNREVVILSKLVWLCQQFDLVVVDLPASGHAASLMAAPHRMLTLFRTGPLYDRGRAALELLSAPGTHLVMTAIPEDMVINETIETWNKIRKSTPELRIPFAVLNQCAQPTLTDDEVELLRRLNLAEVSPAGAEVLRAGRWEASLEVATAAALERLGAQTDMSVLQIPRLSLRDGPLHLIRGVSAALARASRGGGGAR